MKQFWTQLDRRGRAGLVSGAFLITLILATASIWLLRTDYQVLFADLKPQDTAAFAAELDKQKIPYRIGGDGNSILVASDIVHATRLKLMGKDIPLQGAAGFELFNNSDFGMTEFAQKINYQRALQGEITRTILALAEVRDARVHLALPEEGLFKRATARGKAAITLGLQAGAALRPDQVAGIQRLVAAAVPGIAAQDVTIVDQRGIALTRPATEGGIEQGSARLDLKKETEQLLARKAADVLDRTFGAGQAIVSVDVTLNMDMVRTTSEEVLGARGRTGPSAGVIVREREVLREPVAPLDQRGDERPGNLQREVEYQTGRRIEQMVSQPGAVRRIQAVAVVGKALDAQQLEQMRALIAAAVGATAERGDVVVVQSLKAFEARSAQPAEPPAAAQPAAEAWPRSVAPAAPAAPARVVWWLAALLLLAGTLALAWFWRFGRAPGGAMARTLSHADREAALRQIQGWLDAGNPGHTAALPATVPVNPSARGGA